MFFLSVVLKTSWDEEAVRLRRCPFPLAEEEERDRPRVAVARTIPEKASAMTEGKDCLALVVEEEREVREVVEVISRLEMVREREREAVEEVMLFVVGRRVPRGAAESFGATLSGYSSAVPSRVLVLEALVPGACPCEIEFLADDSPDAFQSNLVNTHVSHSINSFGGLASTSSK